MEQVDKLLEFVSEEESLIEAENDDFHFHLVSEKDGEIDPKDRKSAEKTLRHLLKTFKLKSASILRHRQR